MSFKTIYLTLETADAHQIISSEVEGIRSKTVDESIEYRCGNGMLLAVLSHVETSSHGESKLRYQTSIITPALAQGRVKAREIHDAVADYRTSQ